MAENAHEELKPLNITCTSTDCENGLHCFKQKQKRKKKGMGDGLPNEGDEDGVITRRGGPCRACGIDLVDWGRMEKHNLGDIAYTFDILRKELARHYYWHLAIDQHAKNHALRKGSIEMQTYVEKRIRTSVGPEQPYRDGMQTPAHQSGNVVYYAQHATASCCRTCIEIWHGIPQGRVLTGLEVKYLAELAMRYIKERLLDLTPEGKKIPPIRRNPNNNSHT